jgi:hypothetical protein
MGEAGLTERERKALREIEARLRHYRRLDRRLRRLGSPPRRRVWRSLVGARCVAPVVSASSIASACLLSAGIRTGDPATIWVFTGVWTATVLGGARLLSIRARKAVRTP